MLDNLIKEKEKVRCKPCGYVMNADDLEDLCPACGVGRKFFEPYKERISPLRDLILTIDIHPIIVHFPQFIVAILPMLMGFALLFPSVMQTEVEIISAFMGLFLPLSVFGAAITGVFDGKIRFKKVRTPAGIKKIWWSIAMLVFSVATAWFSYFDIKTVSGKVWVLILSLICLAIGIWLAQIGKKLMFAKMAGPLKLFNRTI